MAPTINASTGNGVTVEVTAEPLKITVGGTVGLIADISAHAGAGGKYDVEWDVVGPVQLSREDTRITVLGTTTVTGDQIELIEGVPQQLRATLDTSPLAVGSWRVGIRLTLADDEAHIGSAVGSPPVFTDESDPIDVLPRPFAAGDD